MPIHSSKRIRSTSPLSSFKLQIAPNRINKTETRQGARTGSNQGSGIKNSTSYSYENFSEVNISGIPEVVLFQSSNYQVFTEQGANYTPEFDRGGDALIIHMDPLEAGNAAGRLHIGMPVLTRLELNGGSQVSIQFKDLNRLRAELNGAAILEGEIQAKTFVLEANGLNTCNLSGSVETASLELNGGGTFQLEKLITVDLKLEANGGTKVDVHASRKLDVEANGASVIRYSGNPANKHLEQNGGSRIEAVTP